MKASFIGHVLSLASHGAVNFPLHTDMSTKICSSMSDLRNITDSIMRMVWYVSNLMMVALILFLL
jgi:hypothetical protein